MIGAPTDLFNVGAIVYWIITLGLNVSHSHGIVTLGNGEPPIDTFGYDLVDAEEFNSDTCSAVLKQTLMKMLIFDPSKRLTAQELLRICDTVQSAVYQTFGDDHPLSNFTSFETPPAIPETAQEEPFIDPDDPTREFHDPADALVYEPDSVEEHEAREIERLIKHFPLYWQFPKRKPPPPPPKVLGPPDPGLPIAPPLIPRPIEPLVLDLKNLPPPKTNRPPPRSVGMRWAELGNPRASPKRRRPSV